MPHLDFKPGKMSRRRENGAWVDDTCWFATCECGNTEFVCITEDGGDGLITSLWCKKCQSTYSCGNRHNAHLRN